MDDPPMGPADSASRADPRSAPRPSRREMMLAGAAAAVGLAAGSARADQTPENLPVRPLGKTGLSCTALGLGCFPLGGLPDEDAAIAVVLRALDLGCTYFDTAPSYAKGKSEIRVGKALAQRKDEKVFVATKTLARTADEARRDVEGSLRRLGLERVDLVQVHAITDAADLAKVLAPKGPVAGLEKARDEGLLGHVGFTGHADPAVVRAAIEREAFATALFPSNCVDPHHLSFVKGVLPTAVEKGIGRVAMKVFASGRLPQKGIDAELCLRYVFGLDVATAIVGCRTVEEVDLARRVAVECKRLSTAEEKALLERTRPHLGRNTEWYKRV